jgi:excisionase family DNA binding protein
MPVPPPPLDLNAAIREVLAEVRLLRDLVHEALDYRRPAPVSIRRAARLLEVNRATLAKLVQRGEIRTVPWGSPGRGRYRIPRTEVERIARQGLPDLTGRRPRRRYPRRSPPVVNPDAIRAIRIEDL